MTLETGQQNIALLTAAEK